MGICSNSLTPNLGIAQRCLKSFSVLLCAPLNVKIQLSSYPRILPNSWKDSPAKVVSVGGDSLYVGTAAHSTGSAWPDT